MAKKDEELAEKDPEYLGLKWIIETAAGLMSCPSAFKLLLCFLGLPCLVTLDCHPSRYLSCMEIGSDAARQTKYCRNGMLSSHNGYVDSVYGLSNDFAKLQARS